MPRATRVVLGLVALLAGAPLALALDVQTYREDARTFLVSQLSSPDLAIRTAALDGIGASRDGEWGTQAILDASILDGDEVTAAHALRALGQRGAPAAVAPVAAKLAGDSEMVTIAAADALATLLARHPTEAASAEGALTEAAGSSSEVARAAAAHALGIAATPTAAATLARLLGEDESTLVKRAAAAGLSHVADQPAAATALVGAAAKASLDAMTPDLATTGVSALGFVRGDQRNAAATAAMSAMSHTDGGVRMAAIGACSMLANPGNAAELQLPLSAVMERRSPSVAEQTELLNLELYLALLSKNYDFTDTTLYPDLFPEGQDAITKPLLEARAAARAERPVGAMTATDGMSAAEKRLAASLEHLELRVVRAIGETNLYKDKDFDDTPLTAGAVRASADQNQGTVEKARVVTLLEGVQADRRRRADEQQEQVDKTREDDLASLESTFRSEDKHWSLRIDAASQFLAKTAP